MDANVDLGRAEATSWPLVLGKKYLISSQLLVLSFLIFH